MATELPEPLRRGVVAMRLAQALTGAVGVRAHELRKAAADLRYHMTEERAAKLLEDLARAGMAQRLAIKGPRRYVLTVAGMREAAR